MENKSAREFPWQLLKAWPVSNDACAVSRVKVQLQGFILKHLLVLSCFNGIS